MGENTKPQEVTEVVTIQSQIISLGTQIEKWNSTVRIQNTGTGSAKSNDVSKWVPMAGNGDRS